MFSNLWGLQEGKDVIARATTGSGKTFAYLLPLVQKILGQTGGMLLEGPAAIVLVPSQELCQQVSKSFVR